MSNSEYNPNERYLDETTCAARLGISRMTLLRARQRGEVSFFRVGSRVLYAPRHIQEFLQSRERVAKKTSTEDRRADRR